MKLKFKSWKQTIIPAALAITLAIPVVAYAAEKSGSDGAKSGVKAEHHKVANKITDSFRGHARPGDKAKAAQSKVNESAKIHQQTYMQLLFEKYAPGSLSEWKTAVADREALSSEYQQLMKDDKTKEILKTAAKAKEQQIKKQIADKIAAQKEQLKTKQDELKKKVESGEVSREQLKVQMKEKLQAQAKGNLADKLKNFKQDKGKAIESIRPKAIQQHGSNMKDLAAAIKAEDANAIATALAKQLEELKKQNAKQSTRLAELEQKIADASSPAASNS